MDPRKRQALSLQVETTTKLGVSTSGSKTPGTGSKRPPGIAPLDAMLPEDMRIAHTSTSLELMQAHVQKTDSKKGDTRRERDIQRWRDEAGDVRDTLLIRDEQLRVDRVAQVDKMGSVKKGLSLKIGSVRRDENGEASSSFARRNVSRDSASSRHSDKEFTRQGSSFKSVDWLDSYRPDQGNSNAAAAKREERKAKTKELRDRYKKKREEKERRRALDGRSVYRKAFDVVSKAVYSTMYSGEIAKQRALELERAAERLRERRDDSLNANVILSDELNESSFERAELIRDRFGEIIYDTPGEVLLHEFEEETDGGDTNPPKLCVIEHGFVEIRVALESDAVKKVKNTSENVFENTRVVATLTRGHVFSKDHAVLASLFGTPNNFLVVVGPSTAHSNKDSEPEGLVLWELVDPGAYASMAPSLLRRRARFDSLWSSVAFFQKLEQYERHFLVDAARRETRVPGDVFCVENKPCDALRVVEKGRVFAHVTEIETEDDVMRGQSVESQGQAGGQENLESTSVSSDTPKQSRKPKTSIVGAFNPGDYFGANALMSSKSKASATTTARDVTSVLALSRDAFRNVLPEKTIDSLDFVLQGLKNAGVAGDVAEEERKWEKVKDKPPTEGSPTARVLFDVLLTTWPFLAVGRSVVANAEAAVKRMRPRRIKVGDFINRRGDKFTGAYVVERGTVRVVGDAHGGEFGNEHVEIPEEAGDVSTHGGLRHAFGGDCDAQALTAAAIKAAHSQDHRAPGGNSGLRIAAELTSGDTSGFAALSHPGSGTIWTCSSIACASPSSPGNYVTVWDLSLTDFFQSAGYAVDDKRDRFLPLLAPEVCVALQHLTFRQRQRAADALEAEVFMNGELIITAGAPGDGVYIVESGAAVEESKSVEVYASHKASGVDDSSSSSRLNTHTGGNSRRDSSSARVSVSSATPSATSTLRRGDIFAIVGAFELNSVREKSVFAATSGGDGRTRIGVWRPDALQQLGFLRRALEEWQESVRRIECI